MIQFRKFVRTEVCLAATLVLAGVALNSGCNRKPAAGREVWAEVDGTPIYRDEVERQYRNDQSSGSEAVSDAQALSFKLSIINELINNQILLEHASHAKITVAETEVDSKLAQYQLPFSPEDFQRKLREQGLALNDVRDGIRKGLIIDKLIHKEIDARIEVTDAEIAAFYQRNLSAFNVPETEYHLARIQVTPNRDPQVRNLRNDDASTPAAAERKIEALYARLRNGDDFSQVAQEYSEDPRTSVAGGDMGYVPASALASNPGLRQAIGQMKVGQISSIIRTPTGFHILKLLEILSPGQRKLDDPSVQSEIRRNLTNEKEQLLKAAYIEDLRDKAKVVNFLSSKVIAAAGNPAGVP